MSTTPVGDQDCGSVPAHFGNSVEVIATNMDGGVTTTLAGAATAVRETGGMELVRDRVGFVRNASGWDLGAVAPPSPGEVAEHMERLLHDVAPRLPHVEP